METISDSAIVLRVEDRDVADKYVTCFTKNHGRVRFVAFGAKYQKSSVGRILQVLAQLNLEIIQGKVVDKLVNGELEELPLKFDYKQLAYAAVLAELTEVFTVDHQPEPIVYEYLLAALQLLKKKPPRIVVLAYAVKLLQSTGFGPRMTECCSCENFVVANEDLFFSSKRGGVVCSHCHLEGDMPLTAGTYKLYQEFLDMDLVEPRPMEILGSELMQLEKIITSFILFQVERPLKSLQYLNQMGL